MLLLVPDVAGRIAAGKQVNPNTSPDFAGVCLLNAEKSTGMKKNTDIQA
jgi:hypothetical protein